MVSFFWSLSTGWNVDWVVSGKLRYLTKLSVYHNRLVQDPHQSSFTPTCEQDSKILKLLHLSRSQPRVSNQPFSDWGPWHQTWKCWFSLGCKPLQCLLKVSPQWSRQVHIICQKQRHSPKLTKLETLSAAENTINKSNTHQKLVCLVAGNANQVQTLVVQVPDGP